MTTERVLWITGGGSGMGAASGAAAARSGWTVVLSGRRAEQLGAVADGIRADGGRLLSRSQAKQVNAVMLTCGTYDAAGDFAAAQALYALDAPFTQLALHRGGSLAWGGLQKLGGRWSFAQGWDAAPGERELFFYREVIR